MKTLSQAAIIIVLIVVLSAAAFQLGRSHGFRTGSEWAIVQADIVAREAGLSMPVYFDRDSFRVVFRQPPGLYQKAWKLADAHDRTKQRLQTADLYKVEKVYPGAGLDK